MSDLQRFARYYEEFLRTGATGSKSVYTKLDSLWGSRSAADLSALRVDWEHAVTSDALHLDLAPPAQDGIELDQDEDESSAEEAEAAVATELQASEAPAGAYPEGVFDSAAFKRASDASRSIVRRQRRDPHNRETVVGAGVLGYVTERGGLRAGPLLYWQVDLAYEPAHQRLRLFKRSQVPELNTLILEHFLEESGDIEQLISDLQAVLADAEVTPSLVDQVFRTIAGYAPDPQALLGQVEESDHLGPWLRKMRSRRIGFLRSPVLANGTRSHAFLLRDLQQLAEGGVPVEGSVLESILSHDPPAPLGEDRASPYTFSETADGRAPLYYPFASNPSQRQVGRFNERAPILTVQGPPGTGKSQTIANLVCHLIATGKSVLVTSHQSKAVEVASKHLAAFEGIALSLIQGDRESATKLRAELEAILDSTRVSVADARARVAEGEAALQTLDQSLRALRARYQELRQTEHDSYSKVAAYADLRDDDRLHPDDQLRPGDAGAIAQALPRWCGLYRGLAPRTSDLRDLLWPDGTHTSRVREQAAARAARQLIRLAEPLVKGPVPEAVRRTQSAFREMAPSDEEARTLLTQIQGWLETEGRTSVTAFERLGVAPTFGSDVDAWVRLARRLGTDGCATLGQRAKRLAAWFSKSKPSLGGVPPIEESESLHYRSAVTVLERHGDKFLRWHLDPTVRAARNLLADRVPLRRGAVGPSLRSIRTAIEWTDHSGELQELENHVRAASDEDSPSISRVLSGLRTGGAQARAERLTHLLGQAHRLATGPTSYVRRIADSLNSGQAERPRFDRDGLTGVEARVESVLDEFDRQDVVEAFRSEVMTDRKEVAHLYHLTDLVARGIQLDPQAHTVLEDLKGLETGFDDFIALRDLERTDLLSLPRTLEALRSELTPQQDLPDWLDRMDNVLEAHRLGSLLRQSLAADPDDITDVAKQLRKGEAKRRDFLSEIIKRLHALHQAKGLEDPGCRGELMKLRKLLTRKRLTNSLIGLRDKIDYRALLRVVPAWICTIDDAARLFPVIPGLFDVIVVDEASQCPQTVLFPLAARAKKLVVVGDEKQLQPSFGMFISGAQVEALKAAHEIEALPLGIFVEGRSSLLELADFRSSKSIFLDEHFRCHPAIIHWSNDRFYRNRLKILTHTRGSLAAQPLRVVNVQGGDEDVDSKTNRVEAEAVVREVRRLTTLPELAQASIGVISPFRHQAGLLQALLEREFRSDPELLRRHELIASTADGFQGDERDVILYSFKMGPSSNPNSLGVLERAEERFNVAFTRARHLAVSFLSSSLERLPGSGVTRSWLNHSIEVEKGGWGGALGAGRDHFDSEFEKDVCQRLRERGLGVTTQVPCGGFRIDLVAEDTEGRVLAVECDGSWKLDEFGNLRPEDYQRQDLIERAGWTVHRVSGRRYLLNPASEIDRILEVLKDLPTGRQRAALEGELTSLEAAEPSPDEPAPVEGPPRQEEEAVSSHEDRAEADLLRSLIRWSLLQNKVKGPMFDRLAEIHEELDEGGRLSEEARRTLELLREVARQEGFDPGRDPLQ
jgi:very-short-patch-repair endonuclease